MWQNAAPHGTVQILKNDLQEVSRLAHPYGYGLVYVGAEASATTPTFMGTFSGNVYRYFKMPNAPTADRQFQTVHNVAVENGYTPTALSQGTMRWTVNLHGHRMPNTTPVSTIRTWQFQAAHASFLLYWRPTGSTNPAEWKLADSNVNAQPNTDNNYNFTEMPWDTSAGGDTPYSNVGYPGGNVWQQQSMAGRVWNVTKSIVTSMSSSGNFNQCWRYGDKNSNKKKPKHYVPSKNWNFLQLDNKRFHHD